MGHVNRETTWTWLRNEDSSGIILVSGTDLAHPGETEEEMKNLPCCDMAKTSRQINSSRRSNVVSRSLPPAG
jgi:hypothetical protein